MMCVPNDRIPSRHLMLIILVPYNQGQGPVGTVERSNSDHDRSEAHRPSEGNTIQRAPYRLVLSSFRTSKDVGTRHWRAELLSLRLNNIYIYI